jgi:hypothetical protein
MLTIHPLYVKVKYKVFRSKGGVIMAKVEQKEVYTLEEVFEMLGINSDSEKASARKDIKNGTFPFPTLYIRNRHLVPKKPIDDFLAGFKPQSYKPPWQQLKKGRPRKWIPSETTNLNFPVSKNLNNLFEEICNNINKSIPNPLTKGDFLRLAMEEFIERRPEFRNMEEEE